MEANEKELDPLTCSRCGYSWLPRGARPLLACPQCGAAPEGVKRSRGWMSWGIINLLIVGTAAVLFLAPGFDGVPVDAPVVEQPDPFAKIVAEDEPVLAEAPLPESAPLPETERVPEPSTATTSPAPSAEKEDPLSPTPEQLAARRENAAESKFRLAQKFFDRDRAETGRKWLEELIAEYPETRAAAKAREQLGGPAP